MHKTLYVWIRPYRHHDRPTKNQHNPRKLPRPRHLLSLLITALGLLLITPAVYAKPSEPPTKATLDPTTTHKVQPAPISTPSPQFNPNRAGGPDGGGYVFADIDEPFGLDYNFEADIPTNGTRVNLSDNQMSSAISLGFDFEFYGTTYQQVYICANGFLTFLDNQTCTPTTSSLPNSNDPNAIIAAWWEDLNPAEDAGRIDYQVIGTAPRRQFIVQFTTVSYRNTNNRENTFQIKLYETTNVIEIHYQQTRRDLNSRGNTQTVGIENADGTQGLHYAYVPTNDIVLTEYAIRFWRADACQAQIDGSAMTYNAIQDAVDDATNNALIKVAGTCIGVDTQDGLRQHVYLTKTLTLRGGYTTDFSTWNPSIYATTIDAMNQGRGLYITGTVQPVIEYLTITGGEATGLGGDAWDDDAGGGIYANTASPTIQNCIVTDNRSSQIYGWGGGIFLRDSQGIIRDNLISRNTSGGGGGIELDTSDGAVVTGNTVINNTGESGAGLYLYASAADVTDNSIQLNTAGYAGGGIHLDASNNAVIEDNTILNNTAEDGGGLYLHLSEGVQILSNTLQLNIAHYGGGISLDDDINNVLTGNTIRYNQATYGGGIYFYLSNANAISNTLQNNVAISGGGIVVDSSDPSLTNTLIADNQASSSAAGIYVLTATPQFLHTTIANNTGAQGIYVTSNSTATFTNTILVGHTVGVEVAAGSTAEFNATLWGNTTESAGSGTITQARDRTGDPDFVDPSAGDYHIKTTSAAFDAGVLTTSAVDIDGDARATDHRLPNPPDLGFDENPALTVLRPVAATQTFGAAEVVMVFTDTGTLNAITVTLTHDYPTDQTSNRPVRRYFTINADDTAPFAATMALYYTQAAFDASDITDETTLVAYREVDTTWIQQPSIVDTTRNIVTATQVTGFSRWALGAPGFEPAPTAVRLASFTAQRDERGVLVAWQTAMELDNLGFNLYRAVQPGGKRVRLNTTLIPIQMPGQLMGGDYQWTDTTAQPNKTYAYWLEDRDIHGVATLHGPVIVRATDNPSAVRIDATTAINNLWAVIALVLAGLYHRAVKHRQNLRMRLLKKNT